MYFMILDSINKENDIKRISDEEMPLLAEEIRAFLIEHISHTGGHLGSNMGAVELTMALHKVFDLPSDKLIWDVGHQCYTHKILSGRKQGFKHLREEEGLSGFPKRGESPCDAFDTGHSSTSISAGLGYVKARDLQDEEYKVVSIIGDGSLTGGMAYEALNNAAGLDKNFIIVLNDNRMSISNNVGGMSNYLNSLRTTEAYTGLKNNVESVLSKIPYAGEKLVKTISKAKDGIKQLVIPGMLFENMGITYLGPIDGHNIQQMIRTFEEAKRLKGAILVHVLTEKGHGYEPAVKNPAKFHGTAPFDIATGVPLKKITKASYTDVFSAVIKKLGETNNKIVTVTAAMPEGTGLRRFFKAFPKRSFDVGIAEEHAVTFAAGLSLGGMVPVVALYSSFLQRAFDQVMHDVCMQNLHVVFAVDRAGIVGSDGETHHGSFDLSFLSLMPNMVVMAPKNKWELSDMIRFAVDYHGPIAIRYPKGDAYDELKEHRQQIELGKAEIIANEAEIALIAIGSMVKVAEQVKAILKAQGQSVTLINARFVKPLDMKMLTEVAKNHKLVVTLEENVKTGGFGEQVVAYYKEKDIDIRTLIVAIPDAFVTHGSVGYLTKQIELDAETIAKKIIDGEG